MDPVEEPKVDKIEEPKVDKIEEPKVDKIEEPEAPKTIRLKNGDEFAEATPSEVVQLAEWAIMKMNEKPDEKKVEAEEPPDTNAKIETLENEIKRMQESAKSQQQITELKTVIENLTNKYDYTKNSPKMATKIAKLAVLDVQNNPRLTFEQTFAQHVKDFMEEDKERIDANAKVKASLSGLTGSGGGIPNLDTEKKYTADDMQKGISRAAMRKFLDNLEG